MLASVRAKFTEGFEMADLKAAKAIMDEPRQSPAGTAEA
jgi:hypothetical protein